MSDTQETGSGGIAEVTHDGFSVGSTSETSEEMEGNFQTEADSKEGQEKTDAEKRSDAASTLGKAGGEAAAKARQKTTDDAEKRPEKKMAKEAGVKPEGEGETAKPASPRHDARARVMEATRKLSEERRRSQELEARVAQLEAERKAPAKEGKEAAPGSDRPTVDQFNTWEEFEEALIDWKTDQKINQRVGELRRQADEQRQHEEHAQRVLSRVENFNDRLHKAEETDPELLDRVDPAFMEITPTFLLPPGQRATPLSDIAQAIVESEHGPALMVYLTDHPEEMDKLLQSPSASALDRAIGRIETKFGDALQRAPEVERRAPNKASPPLRPLSGSGQTGDDEQGEDTPFDTWVERENARERRRARGA